MRYLSPPRSSTLVLLKLAEGNFSTSKKSEERRCASRCASAVSTLPGSMVTCTDDFAASSGSKAICPLNFVNRPRVFETTMWRTEKWIAECEVSMFQVVEAICCSIGGPKGRPKGLVHPFRK